MKSWETLQLFAALLLASLAAILSTAAQPPQDALGAAMAGFRQDPIDRDKYSIDGWMGGL